MYYESFVIILGQYHHHRKRNDKSVELLDETGVFYHKHNVRNQYNLILRSNEYKLLLDYIRFSIIIKEPQIECVNEFYKLADIPNVVEAKEILYKKCSHANKYKQTFFNNEKRTPREEAY